MPHDAHTEWRRDARRVLYGGNHSMRIGERAYAPGLRLLSHAHEQASLSLVTSGVLRECRARHAETALPFSVSFMGADIAHDDTFGPEGATLFQVFLDNESA